MDDEPPTELEKKISDGKETMMVTQLIGLGETQRRIYERFTPQLTSGDTDLRKAYKLHQKELELLIAYQNENNEI